jgi:hypothetical protein
MKRTLKRELKVPEIVEGEVFESRGCSQAYASPSGLAEGTGNWSAWARPAG